MSVSDPDGLGGDAGVTEAFTEAVAFTVPTEPIYLGTPSIAPKPMGATVWLPYEADTDGDATADLMLSDDGGTSWTRHAMVRNAAAKRFSAQLSGLLANSGYTAAFDVTDNDGTSGVAGSDRFAFRTLAPWGIVPRATVTVDGEPRAVLVAPRHYWWRGGRGRVAPLVMSVLPSNGDGYRNLAGSWRVRLVSHTRPNGTVTAVTPENASMEVGGGNGTVDGDGWYGPFTADRTLSMGFREGGSYTYVLELSGTAEYLDGTPFVLPALERTFTASVLSPNVGRSPLDAGTP